jgi:hypothetical protein
MRSITLDGEASAPTAAFMAWCLHEGPNPWTSRAEGVRVKDDSEKLEEEAEDAVDEVSEVAEVVENPDVPEADALEQAEPVVPPPPKRDEPIDPEAPEADVLEQRLPAFTEDDDDHR